MRTLFALVGLLLASSPVLAQQPLQSRTDHLRKFDDISGGSIGSGFGTGLVVEAGDADTKATITLSSIYSSGTDWSRRIGIRASAPFDRDKADSVDIGTLSGLSAGTSATFEFSFLKWPLPDGARTQDVENLCESVIMDATGMGWQEFSVLSSMASGGWTCGPGNMTANSIFSAVQALHRKKAACDKLTPSELTDPDNSSCSLFVNAAYTPPSAESKQDVEDALTQNNVSKSRLNSMFVEAQEPLRMWTIGLSGNRQRFSYALSASPDEIIKDQESGSGISVAYTRIGGTFLWTAGISYEKSYEAADAFDICSEIEDTGSLRCTNASLGMPKETESELVFGEVRYLLLDGKIGISPRLEYKTEGSDWALSFPIYMVKNSEGALTAGFVAGYATKDDESSFGVFIGKEFAFFD